MKHALPAVLRSLVNGLYMKISGKKAEVINKTGDVRITLRSVRATAVAVEKQ
jgi:hypothetical protein